MEPINILHPVLPQRFDPCENYNDVVLASLFHNVQHGYTMIKTLNLQSQEALVGYLLVEPIAAFLIAEEYRRPGRLDSLSRSAWYVKLANLLVGDLRICVKEDAHDYVFMRHIIRRVVEHPIVLNHSQWTADDFKKDNATLKIDRILQDALDRERGVVKHVE